MTSKLNSKQERFCHELIIDDNQTQAAIRAGYSKRTARQQGCVLLTNPNVLEKVEELRAKRLKAIDRDGEEVIKRLWQLADSDIKDYVVVGEDGETYAKSLDDIPKGSSYGVHSIKEMRKTRKEGKEAEIEDIHFEYKLHDKVKVLENLGKVYGIYEKDNEQSNKLQIVKLTEDEENL